MKTLHDTIRRAVRVMALFLLLAIPAQAQTSTLTMPYPDGEPPRTTVGFRAGITTVDFDGESVETEETDRGFNAGTYLTYRLGRHLAVQPEVLFTMQRGSALQSRLFRDRVAYRLGFLEVPVLLKAYLAPAESTEPYLFAGPVAGFRLFAETENPVNASGQADPNIEDRLKATQFGLAVGAGFDGYAGRQRITLDARYHWGMTNLLDDDLGFFSRALMVSMGIGF